MVGPPQSTENRTQQSSAEHRAKQSRAEQIKAEQSRTQQIKAEQSRAEHRAEQIRSDQSRAEQSRAQHIAKQSTPPRTLRCTHARARTNMEDKVTDDDRNGTEQWTPSKGSIRALSFLSVQFRPPPLPVVT